MVKNLGNNTIDVWLGGTQDYGQNRTNGNVFFRNDILYSYGEHFILGIKLESGDILLNGDTYSVTTNEHQAWVRGAVQRRGLRYIIVPFSALPRELDRFSIRIIDVEQDREVPYPCRSQRPCHNWQGELMPPGHVHYQHLMGRSVFEADLEFVNWTEQGREVTKHHAIYLSGLDETGRDPWHSYFLAELPRRVSSVGEAVFALKPREVVFAEDAMVDVRRQGEFFFIPRPDITSLRGASPRMEHIKFHNGDEADLPTNYLPHKREGRNERHIATHLKMKDGQLFAKGTVRHTGGDHKMLSLGKVWHEVHENMEVVSFRPGPGYGKVD